MLCQFNVVFSQQRHVHYQVDRAALSVVEPTELKSHSTQTGITGSSHEDSRRQRARPSRDASRCFYINKRTLAASAVVMCAVYKHIVTMSSSVSKVTGTGWMTGF